MTDVMASDSNTRFYSSVGYGGYRTLKIASNLEAALKHEEETAPPSSFRSLPQAFSSGNAGLPVPPRAPRRDISVSVQRTNSAPQKSPRPVLPALLTSTYTTSTPTSSPTPSQETAGKQAQTTGMRPGRNPYINKAPGSLADRTPATMSTTTTVTPPPGPLTTRVVRNGSRRSMSTSTTTDDSDSSNFRGSIDDGASNRISISSKSYPSSSIEGHDEYYYTTNTVRSASRQSFLDFSPVSPSAPQVPPKPMTSSPSAPPSSSGSGSGSASASSSRKPSVDLPSPAASGLAAAGTGASPRAQTSDQAAGSLTTNKLHRDERAELVWRSRKLAQVFGKPPSAFDLQQQPAHESLQNVSTRDQPCTPIDDGFYSGASPVRRHSVPKVHAQQQARNSFLDTDTTDGEFDSSTPNTPTPTPIAQRRPRTGRDGRGGANLESFIFLSDEEDDDVSILDGGVNQSKSKILNPVRKSFDSSVTLEMSAEEVLEEERRRMRDKIAKLHRCLGSRVPTSLILGVDEAKIDASLPPPSPCHPPTMTADHTQDTTAAAANGERPVWLRRRRSSSEATLPLWSDELDRSKEHLDDREKARNVRRAQKMEKMFGVAPPQNLYHTRQSPSTSIPGYHASGVVLPAPAVAQRKASPRRQKLKRPLTSESSQGLLTERERHPSISGSFYEGGRGDSNIYYHYQHSLTQLNDIMDRADTESLLQFDEYLHSEKPTSPPAVLQEFVRSDRDTTNRRLSVASSTKSDRRHSLPASISSAISTISEERRACDMTEFQLRRKKVAKLTRFFGEDYIILLTKVLGSIEKSVEEESARGTLLPDQVQELQQKLRSLRTKRV